MPRQNRVTPFGEILALPERGAWTGNRGCLHDDQGRLGKARWRSKAWLVCRLRFKDYRRQVMTPGRWTELFFLDEATALAAGHRPCAFCRRQDFLAFVRAAALSFGDQAPSAPDLDTRLHAERLDGGRKRLMRARLGDLPDGAMAVLPGKDGAWLRWRGALRRWTPGGYDGETTLDPRATVETLTPPATLAALDGGYVPQVDGSVTKR
ncbi:MAG: hypothetical protein IT563_10660 [Alphaproteobacteria bacterium]|nr:hypothetical protein [Alphaproteobacteria bacterium]